MSDVVLIVLGGYAVVLTVAVAFFIGSRRGGRRYDEAQARAARELDAPQRTRITTQRHATATRRPHIGPRSAAAMRRRHLGTVWPADPH